MELLSIAATGIPVPGDRVRVQLATLPQRGAHSKQTGHYATYALALHDALLIINACDVYSHFGATRCSVWANASGLVVTDNSMIQKCCIPNVLRVGGDTTNHYCAVSYDSRFEKWLFIRR